MRTKPEDRHWLPDPKVRKRYNVSAMTLRRWDQDPEIDFPKPLKINRRNYRDERELELWERQRIGATTAAQRRPGDR